MSTIPNTEATAPTAPAPITVRWCLISHTNIGKTSLARTLLGKDVGDIRDEAHVTDSADEYLLLETANSHRLTLWDTPGFGDSVRLQQRLAQHGNPLGWFLTHVWDRWRDKPFWMSQRAMQAARDHADVVLYLVNAAEDPQDAGYLDAEMRILQWLQKPVVVLLNQIGSAANAQQEQQDIARWSQALQNYDGMVRKVLPLDAFTRSWVHEQALFRAIADTLPPAKQPAWEDIMQAWQTRNQMRVAKSMQALAEYLYFAASQKAVVARPAENGWQQAQRVAGWSRDAQQKMQDAAMQGLMQKLAPEAATATRKMLRLHGLDGKAAEKIEQQLQTYFTVKRPLDATQAGLWGAIASGAATGVGADLAAGGLTFGAGALLGALAGAITFAGAAWGINKARDSDEHSITLSDGFLDGLVENSLLHYMAVAHFGRGKGIFSETDAPSHWVTAIQQANQGNHALWHDIWAGVRQNNANGPATPDAITKRQAAIRELLQGTLQKVLQQLYPGVPINMA